MTFWPRRASAGAAAVAERLAPRLKAEPGLGLLADSPDPHLDWLDLLWGPRFDRAAALDLAARRPGLDAATLLDAGARFDALPGPARQQLRRLIVRHWALPRMAHAAHPAD